MLELILKSNFNINKIESLFIFNHNSLIKDYDEESCDITLDILNLKEFMYITDKEESGNNKELIEKIFYSKNNNNKNIYMGYNINNQLIFFREGITHIQSFDLIDLFKYNINLVKIKLINEKIIIN